jgi:hypothetical protein
MPNRVKPVVGTRTKAQPDLHHRPDVIRSSSKRSWRAPASRR